MADLFAGWNTAKDLVAIPEAQRDHYSAQIEHLALPRMPFQDFATFKTELLKNPGDTIVFTKFADISVGGPLAEQDSVEVTNMEADQYSIQVGEWGGGVGITNKLKDRSWIDMVEEATTLLARDYSVTITTAFRNTIEGATNTIFANGRASRALLQGSVDYFNADLVHEAREQLVGADAMPFMGDNGQEFYVCFLHSHQTRYLKTDPELMAANNFHQTGLPFTGAVGMWDGVVFIETDFMSNGAGTVITNKYGYSAALDDAATAGAANADVYRAAFVGDNSYAQAWALNTELRQNGIEDFGRKIKFAWYAITGFGLVNDDHVVLAETV